ncbi:hypothetical protein R1080702_134 [Cyanophage S-RIM32]|uniref:Uncharacterized protein n=1 Tax=Cyanophage S-RIM32 TaxID=1278479 RepID=A0A127KM28_9CAUD|nr:hypothetical protein BJD26_gp122 [Cyanophage S-RIM32]AMO43143.1 hypothetical protein R1080702_134 [Cyanophage S-RIM32]
MKDLDFIDNFFEEKDYKLLYDRTTRAKIDVLMEEPCPLYEPINDE